MPSRIVGGHSQLGVELNKQGQKTSHTFIEKMNFKKAVLLKSYNNLYVFWMRLSDTNKITKPIPLVGSPEELAMRYGSPTEMEGEWEVLISYKGTSVNRGTANILGRYGTTISQGQEHIEQSNQLNVKGTAFAPPGPGM